MSAREHSEAGSSAVELVMVVVLVMLLVQFVFFCGRAAVARQEVYGAARDAARAASITTAGAAAADAHQAALVTLGPRQAACANPDVDTDVADFRPGGTVRVSVACTVSVMDLGLLAPGAATVRASFVAPIDPMAVP